MKASLVVFFTLSMSMVVMDKSVSYGKQCKKYKIVNYNDYVRVPTTHYLAYTRCTMSSSTIAWSTWDCQEDDDQDQGVHHQALAGHPQQADSAREKNICENFQKYSGINETSKG